VTLNVGDPVRILVAVTEGGGAEPGDTGTITAAIRGEFQYEVRLDTTGETVCFMDGEVEPAGAQPTQQQPVDSIKTM
jgi:hypothetical protein